MYPCILFCSSSGCFLFFFVCFLSLLLFFVVVFVWFGFTDFDSVFIPFFLFLLLFLLLSWCLGFVIIITLLSLCTPWRNKELTALHITNKSDTTITATCTLQTAQRKNNPIWYNWQVCVYIQEHPCIHSTTLIHFQNMLTEILIQLSFTLSANIHWVVAVFCFGLLLLLFYHCFVSVWGRYPDCIFSVSKPILLVIVSVGAVICSFRSVFYNRSFLTQNDLATGKQSKLHDLLFEWFWLIETALWGYCYYYRYYKQSKLTSCSSGQDFNWLKLCFKVIVVIIIIITNSWSWPVRVDRILTDWSCALKLLLFLLQTVEADLFEWTGFWQIEIVLYSWFLFFIIIIFTSGRSRPVWVDRILTNWNCALWLLLFLLLMLLLLSLLLYNASACLKWQFIRKRCLVMNQT